MPSGMARECAAVHRGTPGTSQNKQRQPAAGVHSANLYGTLFCSSARSAAASSLDSNSMLALAEASSRIASMMLTTRLADRARCRSRARRVAIRRSYDPSRPRSANDPPPPSHHRARCVPSATSTGRRWRHVRRARPRRAARRRPSADRRPPRLMRTGAEPRESRRIVKI